MRKMSGAAAAARRASNDAQLERDWKERAEQNKAVGQRGHVTVSKLCFMKLVPHVAGHLSVFPNFRHGNRADGKGVPALSPMSLGPVVHHMPGPLGCVTCEFPPALNLENFHQFAKVFPSEVSDDEVLPSCIAERARAYSDPVPHRHKAAAEAPKGSKNKNVPLYSVFWDADGNEHRFSYVQARWFYCYWYARLARARPEFAELQAMIEDGVSINIIGYDGYDVANKTMRACYEDTSRPFGHEVVLYSLLTGGDNGVQPWDAYYSENEHLYKVFKIMFEKE